MEDNEPNRSSEVKADRRVPKSGEEAVVQCKAFRCLAYKDRDGNWRSVGDDSVLEVLEVVDRF